jgi:hypothetical protein
MASIVVDEEVSSLSLSAYGPARSTVQGAPLSTTDAENRRVLESMQVPCPRHDLPSGKSAVEASAPA